MVASLGGFAGSHGAIDRHALRQYGSPMPTLIGQELETPRLRLRPVAETDAGDLFAIFSDPVVMRYWSTPTWTRPEQATEMVEREAAGLAAGASVRLAIIRADDGAVVGTLSLFALDEQSRRAEIGFALASSAWGQGYAQEAARALIRHAFGVMRLNRLEADIDPRNEGSARVLERLGFRREGLLRERWMVAGEVSDSALYGLLSRDWRSETGG
jgi:[ribosomal protein S5]-alanine N-acetyltransferase